MREFIKTFFETSTERIKNPFIGAFTISWIIFNWRAIMTICFSNSSIENRIQIIDDNYVKLTFNLIYPLILAIIYVGLVPYLMVVFDRILKLSTSTRKENLKNQIIIDLKAKQEISVEENKLEELKADYRDKIVLNEIIQDLNEKLEIRSAQLIAIKEEFKIINEDYLQLKEVAVKDETVTLAPKEIEKLKLEYVEFQNADVFKYFRDIGLSIKKRNDYPYSTQDLVREIYKVRGIVHPIGTDDNDKKLFEFTKKGNFFWREYVLNLKVAKPESENLKTQYKTLSGPNITGKKIDLSQFVKPKKKKE